MPILNDLLKAISRLEDRILKTELSPATLKKLTAKIEKMEKELEQPAVSTPAENASIPENCFESSDTIYIWTDGACFGNPGKGGWGVLIQHNGALHEFSGYSARTTNNIMEMTAALEALKRTQPGSTIVLTTDSQYLIKGITQWIFGWKKRGWKKADGGEVLNKNIWIAIDKEARQRNVTWKWIKGHAGHPENERCDELAKNAIRQQR